MNILTALIILTAVLMTAFLSGIFGMAGGMVLMGVLSALLPIATAMILHGTIQMVSNGYRAFLWRDHILWPVFGRYAIGSVLGVGVLFALAWRPDAQGVYIMLGFTAMLVWVPKTLLDLDITKKWQAEIAGLIVQALNTIAGVAGPLVDLFFVNTTLSRHQIVATKAVTQSLAHLVKIVFWSVPVIQAAGLVALPSWWLILAAIPLSMLGTSLGGKVLNAMSDVNFKRGMKGLVTLIGVVMFLRAANII
ncbi:MAG: TSUP family transporter [Hyphomonas sp.]